tara:strand:- start:194 stop:1831 length:1638 start_codon:yes stop_codon:yes gene_type:complete
MSHKIGRFFSKSIFTKFFFIILPLTSFFISLYQLNHQYDGNHHGIMFSISEDLLNEKIPFKEFFPHYGIFFIYLNALFIKIFFNSIYGMYFLIALSKGLTFFILGMILKNIFNDKVAISVTIIMFLAHPFVDTPWPDYVFFLLILLSFYILFISKNNFLIFLSGFFYSLASLTKENYIIILFLSYLLVYVFLCFSKFIREKKIYTKFVNLYWLTGYLIPLILFFLYLQYNMILNEYVAHLGIAKLGVENFCTSAADLMYLRTLDCGWIALKIIFQKSITKILIEPYWLFFLVIIITNFFFIINKLFFDKNNFVDETNKLMIWISILSLLLFSSNLYQLTIQKLFTGVGIGIIVLVHLVQNLKSPITRYFIYSLTIAFLINAIQFARTPNNVIYPTSVEKNYNYKENIKFLRFKKLSNAEWLQLNEFFSALNLIKKKCSFINFSTNLTNDVFFRIVLKNEFELLNFFPYDKSNKFTQEVFKKFDPLFEKNLNKEILNDNILITIDNTHRLNKKFKKNPKLHLFKSIKYNNYGASFINIYLPKRCKI